MDINKYVTSVEMSNMGMKVTLIDGSKHILTSTNKLSELFLENYIKENFKTHETKILEGWLGGRFDDLSLHQTKEDSERGLKGYTTLDDDLDEFQEKKIRITIEIIEE